MPGYIWGPLGLCMGLLIFYPIFHYRRYRCSTALLYVILTGLFVSLWFLSAIILLRTFWGHVTTIVLWEIVAFVVLVMLCYLVERHAAHRVAIKWCQKELKDVPDSLSFLATPFFKSRKKVKVQKGVTSWILIVSLDELRVVSATSE